MAYSSPSSSSAADSGSSELEFTPPKDLEDSLDGESGDALVHWRRKPNGNVCITSMEGVPLGGEGANDDQDEDDQSPGPGTMQHSTSQLDSMSSQM
jgi:hypothetical protein